MLPATLAQNTPKASGPTTSSLCVGVMAGKVLQCSVDADK
jgi:hypothetical protein